MKVKQYFFILLFLIAYSSFAYSSMQKVHESSKFGFGIVLGEPSGLTAKNWIDQINAIDFGLAYSITNYVLLNVDYLWHFHSVFGKSSNFAQRLTPYIGGGGMVAFSSGESGKKIFQKQENSVALGFRIPIGIEFHVPKPNLGIFLELVPGLFIFPSTTGFLGAGIGVRFYF